MTRDDMVTELRARGFQDTTTLSATRAAQYVNDAVTEFNEFAPWYWLHQTGTGTGTVVLADLRAVLSVRDTTNKQKLWVEDIRTIEDMDPDYTATTGTPSHAYIDGTTVKVWPVSSSVALSVRYVEVPDTLGATDSPTIPTRYHNWVVDLAEAYAHLNIDNAEQGQVQLQEVRRKLESTAAALLHRNYANPEQTLVYGADDA